MDNNKKSIKNRIKSSKKLKYGTSAVVFSVVFVAFVILLNLILTFVDERTGGLNLDLTTKQLYTVSDESVNVLKNTDKSVQIIFCMERGKVTENPYLNYVKELADDYVNKFDNISVVYKDRVSNPSYFNKFAAKSNVTITNDSIIVYCESTGLYKVFSLSSMFVFTTEGGLFAFNGENRITSAIRYVARNDEDMPKVGFVSGHGESVSMNLTHFFTDYGFEVISSVDLKTTSREDLASYDLLVVFNPQNDFIAEQTQNQDTPSTNIPASGNAVGVNEIEKISDYVFDDMGNVVFFFDPRDNTSTKNNLYELVEKSFGVKVDDAYRVDENEMNMYTRDSYFIGTYYTAPDSLGYAINQKISGEGYAKPVFSISSKLEIVDANVKNVSVSPIVTTTSSARAKLDETNYISGTFPLITVSEYTKVENYETKTSNVFVCASSDFVDGLTNPSYANNDLFKRMIAVTDESLISDIDYKVFDESTIDVTKDVIFDMRVRLIVIVPLIMAAVGIAVYFIRKYK